MCVCVILWNTFTHGDEGISMSEYSPTRGYIYIYIYTYIYICRYHYDADFFSASSSLKIMSLCLKLAFATEFS